MSNSEITYFNGKVAIYSVVFTSRPTLGWYKSTDLDNDSLTYQIQISENEDFSNSVVYSDISSVENQILKQIDFDLSDNIPYFWRVRVYDGYEYSEWSDIKLVEFAPNGSVFSSVGATVEILPYEDLGGTVDVIAGLEAGGFRYLGGKISIISNEDLPAIIDVGRFLYGTLYINHSSDLNGTIYTFSPSELEGQVKLVVYWLKNLYGTLRVKSLREISGTLTIPSYKLGGMITTTIPYSSEVIGGSLIIPAHSDLNVSTNIVTGKIGGTIETYQEFPYEEGYINLGGQLTIIRNKIDGTLSIYKYGYSDLGVSCRLSNPGASGIPGSVEIYYPSNFEGTLNIFKNVNLDATLYAIGDYPDDVVVYSDVLEETWQNESTILFQWYEPNDEFSNSIEYYVAFNDDPDYEITTEDQRVTALSISKTIYDTGAWYFHIRAINQYYHMSKNTTHYCVYYNTLPNEISGLLIDGESWIENGQTSHVFSWNNTTDADELDKLYYDFEVYSGIEFIEENKIISETNIPTPSTGSITTIDEDITEIGKYIWRVRPYDEKQYADWTECDRYFETISRKESIGGQVIISSYYIKNLSAKIEIIGHKFLEARLNVTDEFTSDLEASLKVSFKSYNSFGGKIRIYKNEDIPGSINIIPYQNLGVIVNVIDVYGKSDIYAKINVSYKDSEDLGGWIYISEGSTSDIDGTIEIFANSDFSGECTVYTEEHYGFLDQFVRNIGGQVTITQSGNNSIGATVDVDELLPNTPVVSSSLSITEWQTNNNVTFSWFVADNGLEIINYYAKLDQNEDANFSDGGFLLTSRTLMSFDLEIYNGAGLYYFHVAAVDSYGRLSDFGRSLVMYNHEPSSPSSPLLVNNVDSTQSIVVVAKSSTVRFEWTSSDDDDELDSITYQIQVSSDSSFDDTEESYVIFEQETIYNNYIDATISFEDYGIYYWRVCSYDGHEYSEWSVVGTIRVNNPPGVPTNLVVE